jgi:hypothetical protein
MPEYVGNTVTVDGPATILSALVEYKFDFNWIHPVPDDANSDWVSRHWTTNRNLDPSTFEVIEFSEDKTHLKVWFRTAWSCPFALFAYMTKKRNELKVTVRYSGGHTVDYVGFTEYNCGKVYDTRLYPHFETPKALMTFSEANPWFDYKTWKETCDEWGLKLVEDDGSSDLKHLTITEGTYDTIVCGWDDHSGNWQDKCEVCISSNDPANYPEMMRL